MLGLSFSLAFRSRSSSFAARIASRWRPTPGGIVVAVRAASTCCWTVPSTNTLARLPSFCKYQSDNSNVHFDALLAKCGSSGHRNRDPTSAGGDRRLDVAVQIGTVFVETHPAFLFPAIGPVGGRRSMLARSHDPRSTQDVGGLSAAVLPGSCESMFLRRSLAMKRKGRKRRVGDLSSVLSTRSRS